MANITSIQMSDIDEERFHARQQEFLKQVLLEARGGLEPKLKDVHTTHCCATHGCKYGDDNCGVVARKHAQLYPCEGCDFRASEMAFSEPSADAYAQSVVIIDRKVSPHLVYLAVNDGDRVTLAPCATDTLAKAQYADVVWAVKTAYLAGVLRK